MFALVAPAIAAESLNVGAVAAAQDGLWFVVWMPVAFVVYLLGVAAFSVWGPFAPASAPTSPAGSRAELSGRGPAGVRGRPLRAAGRRGGVRRPDVPRRRRRAAAAGLGLGAGEDRRPARACWSGCGGGCRPSAPDKFMEVGWLVLLPAVLLQDLVVAVVARREVADRWSPTSPSGRSGVVAVLAGAAVFYVDSMARATYALALSFVAVGAAGALPAAELRRRGDDPDDGHGDGDHGRLHGHVHGDEPGADADEHGARQAAALAAAGARSSCSPPASCWSTGPPGAARHPPTSRGRWARR